MEWIACPWCACRFEGYPPVAAVVRNEGIIAKRTCPACRAAMLVTWNVERDKILDVRHAPQPKMRWEPTFDGPVDARKR